MGYTRSCRRLHIFWPPAGVGFWLHLNRSSLVLGLIESIERIGKIEDIILTTLDHTRGAGYIAEKTGAIIYLPDRV